jgi:hypothetical protein
VDVTGPGDAWAVGYLSDESDQGKPDQTFAEHWNGTAWSISTVPDVSVAETGKGAQDQLVAVSGDSHDAWAVGSADPLGTLAVHWNGNAWTLVSSPQTGGQLTTVREFSAANVWAAGDEIDHWNGSAWQQMPTINGMSMSGGNAMAASSPNDIWFAMGSQYAHYRCM